MLKPKDIIVPDFSKSISGYKPTEVQQFIEGMMLNYSELYEAYEKREKELKETAATLKKVSEKYQALSEKAAAENMPAKLSADIIDSATTDGAKIIENANAKAAEIMTNVKSGCTEVLKNYAALFENEKKKLAVLENAYAEFRKQIADACTAQATAIKENAPSLRVDEVMNINFIAEVQAKVSENSKASENGEADAAK